MSGKVPWSLFDDGKVFTAVPAKLCLFYTDIVLQYADNSSLEDSRRVPNDAL